MKDKDKTKEQLLEELRAVRERIAEFEHMEAEYKRTEEELLVLSLNDELTGLYNRRGFFTLAEQKLKAANRIKKGMLLLFADVDDLKVINDTFGHLEGDQALIDTANILKETFRESDIIARIGGDEFVILAIETSDSSAETLNIRLQANIKSHNTNERRYKLSMRVGIVRHDFENRCTIAELLAQADKLMYEQKWNKLYHCRCSRTRKTHLSHSSFAKICVQ
jgi:diguanylate cyclase (GGDEF)-like protein